MSRLAATCPVNESSDEELNIKGVRQVTKV